MKIAGSHQQRGQVLPLVAGGVVALLIMAALAVDVGFWRYQQRLLQSAADSAAINGAIKQNCAFASPPPSSSDITTAAQNASSKNGFTDDSGVTTTVTVTPNYTAAPTRPSGTATAYPANCAVQVVVQTNHLEFFSGIVGVHLSKGSARAVAVSQPDANGCLYALNSDGVNWGLDQTGNKDLYLQNCGAVSNGPITVPGFDDATSVSYWTGAGTPSYSTGPVAQAMPAVANDPCPRISSCEYITNHPPPSTVSTNGYFDASQVTSIAANASGGCPGPGSCPMTCPSTVNCAFVSNVQNNTTISLTADGIYYFYGGIGNSGSGTFIQDNSPDGVTIYNVNGGWLGSGLGSVTTNFNHNDCGTDMQHYAIRAPDTGPDSGMAYFQPPSNSNTITFNGGGNGVSVFEGAFYAPSAPVTFHGGDGMFSFFIGGDITDTGGGNGTVGPDQNKHGLMVCPSLSTIPEQDEQFPVTAVLTE